VEMFTTSAEGAYAHRPPSFTARSVTDSPFTSFYQARLNPLPMEPDVNSGWYCLLLRSARAAGILNIEEIEDIYISLNSISSRVPCLALKSEAETH